MARTYPAKRSYIAKGFSFPGCDSRGSSCSCETWTPSMCLVCGEQIEDGQRVVDGPEFTLHARCADAGEALP